MLLHLDIRVSGRVQGVYYRANARAEAQRLGLKGFVRNELDGDVFAEAEGDRDPLQAFVAWCRRGPEGAKVESVEANPGEVRGYSDFRVLQ